MKGDRRELLDRLNAIIIQSDQLDFECMKEMKTELDYNETCAALSALLILEKAGKL